MSNDVFELALVDNELVGFRTDAIGQKMIAVWYGDETVNIFDIDSDEWEKIGDFSVPKNSTREEVKQRMQEEGYNC